ncbi:hypothetical protein [Neptuniibacter halophilus]|uniref:hypothetical protein n=1 Tax=Neptuniibacter halophilus TaxID=651666 RepID=UPI002573FD39|nr:hypothetical protein [Neptuniibacter halophilus]
MRPLIQTVPVLFSYLLSLSAYAGEVEILAAEANRNSDGSYHFQVTLKHADSGWEHYANRWEVVTPEGAVIATRVLHHPHVDEQPFTRGLNSVTIPSGNGHVFIRAYDSRHGRSASEYRISLPQPD